MYLPICHKSPPPASFYNLISNYIMGSWRHSMLFPPSWIKSKRAPGLLCEPAVNSKPNALRSCSHPSLEFRMAYLIKSSHLFMFHDFNISQITIARYQITKVWIPIPIANNPLSWLSFSLFFVLLEPFFHSCHNFLPRGYYVDNYTLDIKSSNKTMQKL